MCMCVCVYVCMCVCVYISVCVCMFSVCVCMFSQLKIEAMLFIQGSYSFSVLVEWWLSGELIWDPLLWVYVY